MSDTFSPSAIKIARSEVTISRRELETYGEPMRQRMIRNGLNHIAGIIREAGAYTVRERDRGHPREVELTVSVAIDPSVDLESMENLLDKAYQRGMRDAASHLFEQAGNYESHVSANFACNAEAKALLRRIEQYEKANPHD